MKIIVRNSVTGRDMELPSLSGHVPGKRDPSIQRTSPIPVPATVNSADEEPSRRSIGDRLRARLLPI